MTISATPQGVSMANVEIARQLYDAFNRGDIPAVIQLFDPAIEFSEAEGNPYRPDGTPWVGPQAIVSELFSKIPQDFDRFAVVAQVIVPMEGGTVTQGRYQAVCKRTGRTLDARICHLMRMRDGRITHFQQYIDTAQLQWALADAASR